MAIVSDPVREEEVMVRFFGRAVKKAADMGIDKVMLTCEPDNISSRKVIEANKENYMALRMKNVTTGSPFKLV